MLSYDTLRRVKDHFTPLIAQRPHNRPYPKSQPKVNSPGYAARTRCVRWAYPAAPQNRGAPPNTRRVLGITLGVLPCIGPLSLEVLIS